MYITSRGSIKSLLAILFNQLYFLTIKKVITQVQDNPEAIRGDAFVGGPAEAVRDWRARQANQRGPAVGPEL